MVRVGAVAGPQDPEAAGDLLRETAAEAGGDQARPAFGMDDAIAAAVHAVTAVIEGGAAFGSQVLGAH